ncbi:SMI1/KNR4 family protein [Jeotgalibacillus sp. ET6]|uniref:SMI1/KNR4 family protein n=1 Tax=Jeotgalibacillus sp. ET6 TaxID=3037260 RepID=UPI0024182885|nr:SMI1/KNR4 family protein [Jeotgalibacillus sp. ET6]MDG5471415.1 SMI1/KNR4 family protein [Jeotgalibacillus sp. ET6]
MEELSKILPPPKTPQKTGDKEQWRKFFGTLGTELPSDYVKYIETYGTGGIDHFLWILTPFANDKNVNYLCRQKEIAVAYIQSKRNFPQYYKHDVYPSNGGLLPWAYTDNGDELYWLTDGKPDEWKIVVYESRSLENYTYSLTMVEFLSQIITKELRCKAFPDDFPSNETTFVSVC